MRRPADLLRGLDGLASLPGIYLRLARVVSDPRSSAADVGRVIADDPGLTARLLRLVNSAMYGFPSRIETVSHAISIVGTVQLQDLALATTVVRLFATVPEQFVTMDSFWRHSVACGVAARAMAARRREGNVERHFVAGLLHDIGRPIMFLQAPEEARAALTRSRETGEPLYQAERAVLGFDHAHVGHALLERWHLPPSLTEAVNHHHAPGQAARFPLEAALVHVADLFANTLRFGTSGENLVPALDPGAWDRIGLAAGALGDLFAEVEQQYEAVVHVIAAGGG